MATNGKSWPLKLKERCQAVGWQVVMTKRGHYRVRVSGGRGFTFPSTPSDPRSERNALADARRYGLIEREERLAKRREFDRKERIRKDRTAVEDAFIEAVIEREADFEPESTVDDEEGDKTVQKEVAQVAGALGYVDGVAVAEKAPAMHSTPVTRGKLVPLVDGEELLLVDGRVTYRCNKPAATVMDPSAKGVCHRTFESVGALKGHITYHSRKTRPVSPGTRRKTQREAAVAAGRAALARGRRTKPAEPSAPTAGVVARMLSLEEQFRLFQSELDALAKSAVELAAELHAIAEALPAKVATPETLEAAEKYEQLRKLVQ